MKLGDLIKQYRDEHGISMDAFSQKTGLSKSYISMLERNKDPRGNEITPSIETIYKVSRGLNMSFDDVFRALDQNQKVKLNSGVDDNLMGIFREFEAALNVKGHAVDLEPTAILNYLKSQIPAFERAVKSVGLSAPPLSNDETDLLSMYRELSDERKKDVIKFTKMFYDERV